MAMRAQDEVLKHNVYEFCIQCCIIPDVRGARKGANSIAKDVTVACHITGSHFITPRPLYCSSDMPPFSLLLFLTAAISQSPMLGGRLHARGKKKGGKIQENAAFSTPLLSLVFIFLIRRGGKRSICFLFYSGAELSSLSRQRFTIFGGAAAVVSFGLFKYIYNKYIYLLFCKLEGRTCCFC